MSESIISVEGLRKTFKVHQRDKSDIFSSIKSLFVRKYMHVDALQDVTMSINKGEIRGLIGPNGAGKSTFIKILCGILYPTEGVVNVNGLVPWEKRETHVKNIGVVLGQKSQLWWDLPPIDAFALNRKMYDIPDKLYKENIELFIELLNIKDVVQKPVRQLSLGERMKCEFVCSLLHQPPLVFLDEPTIGLDIISKESIRNFIKCINKEKNITFIVTTHDLNDIEDLCKKVTIINNGSIVFNDYIDQLLKEFSSNKIVEVKFHKEVISKELLYLNPISYTPFSAKFEIDISKRNLHKEISNLLNKFPIIDININSISIENIIKQIYLN